MKKADNAKRAGAFIIDYFIGSTVVTIPIVISLLLTTNLDKIEQLDIIGIFYGNTAVMLTFLISIIIINTILFIVIPKITDSTIGQKTMKLKVVDSNNQTPNALKLFIRTLLIPGILFNIISLCLILFTDSYTENTFMIIDTIDCTVVGLSALSILIFKNGIHEMISGTKIIETNKKTQIKKENNVKKEKKKLPKWVIVLVTGIIVVYIGFMGLCVYVFMTDDFDTSVDVKYKETESSINIDDGNYKIDKTTLKGQFIKAESKEDYDRYVISGIVKKNKKKNHDDLGIKFKLYDATNTVVGTATAYIEKMKTGESWKIKAEYEESDAANVVKFKISEVGEFLME